MAIGETYLSVLQAILALRDPSLLKTSMTRTICLSYPDIVTSGAAISRMFGEDIMPTLKVRSDQAAIKDCNNLPDDFGPVYDTESLF